MQPMYDQPSISYSGSEVPRPPVNTVSLLLAPQTFVSSPEQGVSQSSLGSLLGGILLPQTGIDTGQLLRGSTWILMGYIQQSDPSPMPAYLKLPSTQNSMQFSQVMFVVLE